MLSRAPSSAQHSMQQPGAPCCATASTPYQVSVPHVTSGVHPWTCTTQIKSPLCSCIAPKQPDLPHTRQRTPAKPKGDFVVLVVNHQHQPCLLPTQPETPHSSHMQDPPDCYYHNQRTFLCLPTTHPPTACSAQQLQPISTPPKNSKVPQSRPAHPNSAVPHDVCHGSFASRATVPHNVPPHMPALVGATSTPTK